MDLDRFMRNFESALEDAKPNSLTPETAFESIDGWDSLAVLMIIAMIDSEYSVGVSADEFIKCKTVRELFDLVSKKVTQ